MKRIMVLGIAVMVLASLGCARENLRQSQQAQLPQPAAAHVNMQMPAAAQQQKRPPAQQPTHKLAMKALAARLNGSSLGFRL